MSEINSLVELRAGDIMFGPIGGLVGVGVGLGQLALSESFHVGKLSIRHVGIVVEPATWTTDAQYAHDSLAYRQRGAGPREWLRHPQLVQAMPHGAEQIELRKDTHWTERHAYVRLPEDYPGQALDAAAIAKLMVTEGVDYSFASYAALIAWKYGLKAERLEKWINRRRPSETSIWPRQSGRDLLFALPCEAICSVLVDQAWSLAGKRVVEGTKPQVVTPGMMANQLWRRQAQGVEWGGLTLL